MLIDGPASDITSSRKRNLGMLVFSKQRAHQIIGSPDLFDVFIIYTDIMNRRPVDFYCGFIDSFHHRTDAGNSFKKHVDITDIRQIFDQDRFICHDRGRKDRKRRIFCSGNFDLSYQRISASYDILFHIIYLYLHSHAAYRPAHPLQILQFPSGYPAG